MKKHKLTHAEIELHNIGTNARIKTPAKKLLEQMQDERQVIIWLIDVCEKAARRERNLTARDLAAWAARAKDFESNGLKSESLMALDLEGAANVARKLFNLPKSS